MARRRRGRVPRRGVSAVDRASSPTRKKQAQRRARWASPAWQRSRTRVSRQRTRRHAVIDVLKRSSVDRRLTRRILRFHLYLRVLVAENNSNNSSMKTTKTTRQMKVTWSSLATIRGIMATRIRRVPRDWAAVVACWKQCLSTREKKAL